MKTTIRTLSLCIALLAVHPTMAQLTLPFDAFQPGNESVVVSNGYGNVDWTKFGVINGSFQSSREGYRKGVVSPQNVAFNLAGEPASIRSSRPFTLNSAHLTAAFVQGLQVQVRGYAGTDLLFDSTHALNTTGPTLVQFNYAGVDRVTFTATPESQFVLDDLTLTHVTDPNCNLTLDAGERTHNPAATTGTVGVTASGSCVWTIQNSNSWISILSDLTNSGNATVSYQLAANESGLPRTGLIEIGNQTFWVSQRAFDPPGTNVLHLGRIVVESIVNTSGMFGGTLAHLISQRLSPQGAAVLSEISTDWNTNSFFALTVAAPAGQKFLVAVPPGGIAQFGGFLWWESPGRGGISPPGDVIVKFTGLEGMPPDFTESTSVLSGSHGFFGCVDMESTRFNNSFAFTEMEIIGKVAPQATGLGGQIFVPHGESALFISCRNTETNAAAVISIVPEDTVSLAATRAVQIRLNSRGKIVVNFAGVLQAASSNDDEFVDVPGNPQGIHVIPDNQLSTPTYFRVR